MGGRRHLISVEGGTLVADDEGHGPPILLVHSATVDRRSWDDVVPRLVEGGFRAVRYDIRGFGESTTSNVEYAGGQDLLAVMDALDLGQVAVVGNSLGTVFALDAILQAPERFVSFTWIGGGVGGFRGADTPDEAPVFEAWRAADEGDDLDAAAELNVCIWLDGIGQSPTRVPKQIREKVRAMNRPLMEKDRAFGSLRRPDPTAATRLHELKLPTLAIVGELDTNSTKEAARLLATKGGAMLINMQGVAHLPGMETPDRIAELILLQVRPLAAWQ